MGKRRALLMIESRLLRRLGACTLGTDQRQVAFLRILLFVSIPVAWVLFGLTGITGDVPGTSYSRFFYHALPVALSVLYRAWPYDHTADDAVRSTVWSQDLGQSLDQTIANSISALSSLPAQPNSYFWMVDDRGLADFVVAAFWLFGPTMESLSVLWFVILSITATLFVLSAGSSKVPLLLGNAWLWSLAVSSTIWIIPLDPEGQQYDWILLHLTESRFFTLLAVLPVMGVVVLAWRYERWSWLGICLGVAQLAVIGYLTTVRSTVDTLGLFAGTAVGVVIIARCMATKNGVGQSVLYAIAFSGASLAILFVVPSMSLRAIENPQYTEIGARTLWHNALMSYSHSPVLSEELPMTVSDHDAIGLVIARREAGSLEKASRMIKMDPTSYRARAQEGLNWTSTAVAFDWPQYEADARSLYFEIWRTYPIDVAKLFLVDKPEATVKFMFHKLGDPDTSSSLLLPYTTLAALALAIGLVGRLQVRIRSAILALVLLVGLLATTLIPSYVFYLGSTQMGESFVLIGAAVAFIALIVPSWIRTRLSDIKGVTRG